MKQLFLFLALLSCHIPLLSQNYQLRKGLKYVEGSYRHDFDLNLDGKMDAIFHVEGLPEGACPYIFMSDGTQIYLPKSCGHFECTFQNGIFQIYLSTGTRMSSTYIFRGSNLVLIGYNEELWDNFYPENEYKKTVNLSTGQYDYRGGTNPIETWTFKTFHVALKDLMANHVNFLEGLEPPRDNRCRL